MSHHRRRLALALLLVAAGATSACSSDGDDGAASTTAAESEASTTAGAGETTTSSAAEAGDDTTTTTAEADGEPTGELPTYEELKAIYLDQADDKTITSCQGSTNDRDLYTATGEATRFECGDFGRFEYYQGAEVYEQNWASISEAEVYRSVFHVPGELIVVPVGANDTFAPDVAEACGCGEVLVQRG